MYAPGTNLRWWLLWAAVPYGMAARFRALLYRWGWYSQRKLSVPVISVGNLTVGGTGKTPVVIRLAEWLLADGKRIAILSRGYRRRSPDAQVLVSDGVRVIAGPEEAGDEPYLIARRCPQAIVAVGSDRYRLGCWVLSRFPVDCLLLDDGFQHLGLHRDLNLLLVDATDLAGLDAVVPAGRLREPIQAAARADLILVTRAEDATEVELVLGRLHGIPAAVDPVRIVFRPEGLVSVMSPDRQPLHWCKGKAALLVSGIGHARSFRTMAESLGMIVRGEVTYRDHHAYSDADVARLREQAAKLGVDFVMTTEKDAGKLARLLSSKDSNWWALRLGTEVTAGEQRLRESVLAAFAPGNRGGLCVTTA
ncbi:MAG TPA: tetraacyldisaccharide 4'-kinase [Nitrospira sp.]|nr:tetraacyldisaccharide 4'-kinase [Nitrospira sp.]